MWYKTFVLLYTAATALTKHFLGLEYLDTGTGSNKEQFPLLCYYSIKEPMTGLVAQDLNPDVCSHVILMTSTIDDNNGICFNQSRDGPNFAKLVSELRKMNPKIKLIICNGGGNNKGFERVLASETNRTRFKDSTLPFLQKYGLDGIDLDWEFPGWPGPFAARKNFTKLLDQIREELDKEHTSIGRKYTLSAAVAAGRSVMESYDIPSLGRILDFINLMCYDFHHYGPIDPVTDYNSPLYPRDWAKKIIITSGDVAWSSKEWWKRGMPKEKIMVGVPTYAVTWTLQKPDQFNGHYAPAIGHGRTCQECTYPWVCRLLQSGARRVFDEEAAVPYTYKGDQWVSYDDRQSLQAKANWIIDNKFGGIMVFSMNDDDFNNTCQEGHFPLLTSLRDVIQNKT